MKRYEYVLRDGYDGTPLKILKEFQYTILVVINNVRRLVPRSMVYRQKTIEAMVDDCSKNNGVLDEIKRIEKQKNKK